jgi:threonine dehydrogenase-like Zn-dependent dehydrogenase
MLEYGKINLKKIVSNIFPLSKYREAFNMVMNKKGLKIILIPDEEYGKNRRFI